MCAFESNPDCDKKGESMKAVMKTKQTVLLELEYDEAQWLLALVQNPVIETEDKFTKTMRNLVWVTLSNQGVKL